MPVETWPPPDAAAVAFARDGAAALGPVLDAAQLATVHACFDDLLEHAVTGGYASIVPDGWRRAPALAALVPGLGAIACAALGLPALVLFHDHLLHKPPDGEGMGWHQDFSYLPLDRPDGLTLWVALDDVGTHNGCLYYMLGSHTLGERRAGWGLTGDDDPRASLPPIEVPPDQPGLPAPTAAGCAIAHHTYLWHRSPPNSSRRVRRAWALSFTVPEARWSPRHSPHRRSAMSRRAEGQALEDDLLTVSVATPEQDR